MAQISLSEFLPYVLPEVPGCPKELAEAKIRDSAIEFCEKTHIWMLESNYTDIEAEVALYSFGEPVGTQVVTVDYVEIDEKPLIPKTETWLNKHLSNWRNLEQEYPDFYYLEDCNTVRLVGIPKENKSAALLMKAVIKPSRDATTIDSAFLENWVEGIAGGALYRIKKMPNQQFTNLDSASSDIKAFRRAVSNARAWKIRSGTKKQLRVEYQPFGGINE